MKSFSIGELKRLVDLFQSYTGAQVQEVISAEKQLVLALYLKKKFYILIDLHATRPVILLSEKPFPLTKKVKPMLLFLKKYLVDFVLSDVALAQGRVLIFSFTKGDESHQLEVRLFPHGQNIIANIDKKSMSWFKPKEISPNDYDEPASGLAAQEIMRAKIEEFFANKQVQKSQANPKKDNADLIKRIEASYTDDQRAEQLQIDILDLAEQKRMDEIYQRYKITSSTEWFTAINILKDKLSHEENKKLRLKQRILELKLQAERGEQENKSSNTKSSYYLVLSEGKRALLGKNAKENMALLRSAKPWFAWLHVRGIPSAHIIIEKTKQQDLKTEELIEVGSWLVKRSNLAKTAKAGDYFDLQHSECRYVRPIKGDKAGRVRVEREKVLRFKYKPA